MPEKCFGQGGDGRKERFEGGSEARTFEMRGKLI